MRDQQAGVEALGIVFGGSGNGEQIAANKVPACARRSSGTTAPRCSPGSTTTPTSSRSAPASTRSRRRPRFIDAFIAEPFSFEERHVRRIAQLAEYEATGDIAGKNVDR